MSHKSSSPVGECVIGKQTHLHPQEFDDANQLAEVSRPLLEQKDPELSCVDFA